jgi:hypothetical protein
MAACRCSADQDKQGVVRHRGMSAARRGHHRPVLQRKCRLCCCCWLCPGLHVPHEQPRRHGCMPGCGAPALRSHACRFRKHGFK